MEKVMNKKLKRTSQSLRDVLFDEIEELRNGSGDPSRALAVANLAKQIINVAKVELDFHREAFKQAEAGNKLDLGQMQLGSAEVAAQPATDRKPKPEVGGLQSAS
jgi:hypothetical protein